MKTLTTDLIANAEDFDPGRIGIGPWSVDLGILGLPILVIIIGIVIYYIRKDD